MYRGTRTAVSSCHVSIIYFEILFFEIYHRGSCTVDPEWMKFLVMNIKLVFQGVPWGIIIKVWAIFHRSEISSFIFI